MDKAKREPNKSNDEIYILGLENSEGRVREDIKCYICTLIIDRKTPIIYDLNKFSYLKNRSFSYCYLKIHFFIKYLPEKNSSFVLPSFIKWWWDRRSAASSRLTINTPVLRHWGWWRDTEVSVTRRDDVTLYLLRYHLTEDD